MKRFKKVYIEITNICNLDCTFCPKNARQKQFMTLSNFQEILAQIEPYTDYIYLHVMGEPLLHEQLEEFILVAKAQGFHVNITTNGTLIAQRLDCLVRSPVRKIAFSLHSYAVNAQSVTLEQYVLDILEATQELKSSTICELRFWDKSANEEHYSAQNLAIFDIVEQFFHLNYKLSTQMKCNSLKISDSVYIGTDAQFEWPKLGACVRAEEKFCYGLRSHIGVLVDGTVVPCCLDSEGSVNLGNVLDTPLQEILNSTKVSEIYEGFSRRKATAELCKTCQYATQHFKV